MIQIGIPELLVFTLVILFSVRPGHIQRYFVSFFGIFVPTPGTLSTTLVGLSIELLVEGLDRDFFNEETMEEFAQGGNEPR
jgi:hypothetical protein